MPRPIYPQYCVSVNVASLSDAFNLTGVFIGLGGDEPDLDHWLYVLHSPHMYSEEAFEWKIAELLPCPRSFLQLVYDSDGLLRVMFGARDDSIVAAANMYETSGYCALCFSRLSFAYQRCLLEDEYGTVHPVESDRDVLDHICYSGEHFLCCVCFNSKTYINFYFLGIRPVHIDVHEQMYLDRLNALFDSFPCAA